MFNISDHRRAAAAEAVADIEAFERELFDAIDQAVMPVLARHWRSHDQAGAQRYGRAVSGHAFADLTGRHMEADVVDDGERALASWGTILNHLQEHWLKLRANLQGKAIARAAPTAPLVN